MNMTSLTGRLIEPFALDFLQRALLGGALVAVLCGVVGTWVVIRGMAFLGEALAHGMLPGVALATVLGLPVLVGGAVSAVAMVSMCCSSTAANMLPGTLYPNSHASSLGRKADQVRPVGAVSLPRPSRTRVSLGGQSKRSKR